MERPTDRARLIAALHAAAGDVDRDLTLGMASPTEVAQRCDGASIVRGDALAIPLGDQTVDCIVTSPPYFALRSYQDGGEHYDGQIGSEPTPTAFLEALWAVTAECWRVLKPGGSLFVNLGDKYAGTGGGNGQSGLSAKSTLSGNGHKGGGPKIRATPRGTTDRFTMPTNNTKQTSGLVRSKSLMGLPWRYAIGCTDPDYREWVAWKNLGRHGDRQYPDMLVHPETTDDRWILRQELVWSKPNGMPESVTDRGRRSHEQFFHFTKNGTYWADVDPIREPHACAVNGATFGGKRSKDADDLTGSADRRYGENTYDELNPLGKLPNSVWTIPTQPLQVPAWLDVDHFAAFPTEWPRRIISAWTPSGICTACGEGRRTVSVRVGGKINPAAGERAVDRLGGHQTGGTARSTLSGGAAERYAVGEACACPDTSAPTKPAVVLDPFGGTGTTAMVARALGRYGVSMDLSADYLRLARWRIWESGGAEKVARRTAETTADPNAAEAAFDTAAALADPDQPSLFTTTEGNR